MNRSKSFTHLTLLTLAALVSCVEIPENGTLVSSASGGTGAQSGGSAGSGNTGNSMSQGGDGNGSGTGGTGNTGNAGGGSTGNAGSANTGNTGGSGGDATATGGGDDGSGATAGSGGSGIVDEPGYSPPPREIEIDDTRDDVAFTFSPTDASPSRTVYHGDQYARFSHTSSTIQKKLVVALGGISSAAFTSGTAWALERGYHVLAVDYFNSLAGTDGLVYLETWSGQDVSADADVTSANGIQNRVKDALGYLQSEDAGGDWAYYLDAGEVRWNDVIVYGYSYGGQVAAAATKYVALHRAIAVSGPNIVITAG
jgi:pimeloyl-ACP methyl ester carboxylesterase